MAGDWIAMTHSLCDKPEVRRIARKTGISVDECVGKLHRFWCWLDGNTVDGVVDGVVSTDVDDIVKLDGFASALHESSWAYFDDESEVLTVPNFDNYNGETAKKRMQKNKRQARWRNKNNDLSSVDGSASTGASKKASTREEKRREENNKDIVEQARHCIDYLNETCGTNYKHVDANTSLVSARLKEGHTVDDIKSVIDSKRTEWMDTDQQMYLRPKTLFSAQNFNNYIGQVGLAKTKKQNWASLSPFELEEKCEQLGIHTKGLSPQAVIAELERAHQ